MKLSQTDRNILKELEINAKVPVSKISRKLRISKQAVYRHMDRYLQEGLIQNFWTVIDFGRLGYSTTLVLFRLRTAQQELGKKIPQIKVMNGIGWVAETSGAWDLAINIIFRNNHDFSRKFSQVCNVLKDNIEKTMFIPNLENYLCSYGHLFGGEKMVTYRILKDTKPIKITEEEFKMLRLMSNNARISTQELGKKTGLSFPTIKKKIRQLEIDKVIAGYTPAYDYNLFNASWFVCIFKINKWENIDQFIEYVKKIPEVTYIVTSSTDILNVEFITGNPLTLRKITDDLHSKFSGLIRTFDVLSVLKVHNVDYLPFDKLDI